MEEWIVDRGLVACPAINCVDKAAPVQWGISETAKWKHRGDPGDMVTLLELGRAVQDGADGADIPAVNLGVRVPGETKPGREVEQRMYAAELKADSLPWVS